MTGAKLPDVHALDALPQPFLAREVGTVGVTGRRLARLAAGGHLVRLGRGLYAVRSTWSERAPVRRHGDIARAASRWAHGSVVSHRSAAILHGLPHPLADLGPAKVTLPAAERTSMPRSWCLRHRADLPPHHVTLVEGVPLTGVARTVVDGFRDLPLSDAVAIGDAALSRAMTGTAELRSVRSHEAGWPGVDVGAVVEAKWLRERRLVELGYAVARWTPHEIVSTPLEVLAEVNSARLRAQAPRILGWVRVAGENGIRRWEPRPLPEAIPLEKWRI